MDDDLTACLARLFPKLSFLAAIFVLSERWCLLLYTLRLSWRVVVGDTFG